VDRAGDPRVRGPVAPSRRPWRRRPAYVYRLADLDELFATAEARTDATTEQRRDRFNRRSNWRVIGVVLLVAAGLAVATAGLVNEAVMLVTSIFGA
jgi:anti-sigma-K factor RskA